MKKTYFAPELVKVELNATPLMQTTSLPKDSSNDNAIEQGGQLSKGFSGSLWDDGDAEEN